VVSALPAPGSFSANKFGGGLGMREQQVAREVAERTSTSVRSHNSGASTGGAASLPTPPPPPPLPQSSSSAAAEKAAPNNTATAAARPNNGYTTTTTDIGGAEVRALLDDARDVVTLLTREIVRLRGEKCDFELRLRDEELVGHRARVAALDETHLRRFGPKATPLPSLDDGGALDRDVLIARLAEAEARADDFDRRLRKRRGEHDRLRAELKVQVDARQEDLAAIQRLAKQSAAVAAKLDAANAELAAAARREAALKRRANEVTQQVRDATKGTIEALEQALNEALEHNRVLTAELQIARRSSSQN
jgi:cell division septum initiation protein DivIVA